MKCEDISRKFFFTFGLPAIRDRFPGIADRCSAGLFMCFYAQMARTSALPAIAEEDMDACLVWEKTRAGKINLMWVEEPEFGTLAYKREVVFFFTPPDITAVCKAYKKYEIEKGRFKTWKEKIAERPAVKKLPGSMTAFIGYHDDTALDYRKNLLALKKMGVKKARIVPTYIGTTVPFDYPEKGVPVKPLDITRLHPLIRKLGYSASGFIYITAQKPHKGKNAFRDIMLGEDGKPKVSWVMPDGTFYYLAVAKRLEWAARHLNTGLAGCDGVHYDTLTASWMLEDWTPGRRTSARDDYEGIRTMMQMAGARNMYVTAEGFCGRLTPYYDMGSTKFIHMICRDEYYCVPMTRLVYHECAFHGWWEIANYNNPIDRSRQGDDRYYFGAGYPALQSAIDAISGNPPDIFPFGLQYTFVPKNEPDIFFYRMRLDDKRLREVMPYAKAAQKIFARVATQEIVDYKIHKDDGAVQESVFADGTRVIGNFSNTVLEAPGVGLMQPESYIVKKWLLFRC